MNEPVSPITSSAPSSPSSSNLEAFVVIRDEPSTNIMFSQEDFTKISFLVLQMQETLGMTVRRFGQDESTLALGNQVNSLFRFLQNGKPINQNEPIATAPLKRPKSKTVVHDPSQPKRKRQRRPVPPLPQALYCRACGETNTCEWRRGPDGLKSLCNACGIHYAKVVKKEAAAEYTPKNVKLDMLLN